MRIVVAGATGALGKQLVPRLVEHGHEVTGMTRTPAKQELLRGLGATPAVADALDPEAVARVVARGPARRDHPRAHRVVATRDDAQPRPRLRADQSPAHRSHRPPAGRRPRGRRQAVHRPELRRLAGRTVGGPVKTEDDPFDTDPPSAVRETRGRDPLRRGGGHRGASGPSGSLCATAASTAPARAWTPPAGEHVDLIRKRRMPIVGRRAGRVVVHPHRRRRRGDGRRADPRRARRLQHRRRRTRPRSPSGCPRSQPSSAPSRRCTSRGSSGARWPGRRRR